MHSHQRNPFRVHSHANTIRAPHKKDNLYAYYAHLIFLRVALNQSQCAISLSKLPPEFCRVFNANLQLVAAIEHMLTVKLINGLIDILVIIIYMYLICIRIGCGGEGLRKWMKNLDENRSTHIRDSSQSSGEEFSGCFGGKLSDGCSFGVADYLSDTYRLLLFQIK